MWKSRVVCISTGSGAREGDDALFHSVIGPRLDAENMVSQGRLSDILSNGHIRQRLTHDPRNSDAMQPELKEVVSRGLPRASGFTVRREADRGCVFNNMPLNRRAAEGTHTRSPSKNVSSSSALSWIWKE